VSWGPHFASLAAALTHAPLPKGEPSFPDGLSAKVCRLCLIFGQVLADPSQCEEAFALLCRWHPRMPLRKMKSIGLLFLGCCLMTAAAGCSIHRTAQGLAFDSHWSLGCSRHAPWITLRSTKDADCGDGQRGCATASDCGINNAESAKSPASLSDSQLSGKPEVLPWRSRLKGYRLGARIFRGKESSPETAAGSSAEKTQLIPPPELIIPPEDFPKTPSRTSASKSGQRQPSGTVAELREPTKPDPVVE
jgi:hypothetical protein